MKIQTLEFNTEFCGQSKGFNKIPNGYIDKQICGCGLTSVALENEDNNIIAVPTKNLVINKVNQYPNQRFNGFILGVYGNITNQDIQNYLKLCSQNEQPIKIMVTFDSIYKVVNLLNICNLIIDESNQLFKYIGLKIDGKEEIDCYNYLLDIAEKYKDKVSFVSATPIPVEYFPKWVQDLDQYRFTFKNTIEVRKMLMQRNKPYQALKDEIIRPLNQTGSIVIGDRQISKVIVFINSVKTITAIIRDCKLNKDDIAIICGDSIKNDCKIRGYNRIEKYNDLPKYTFITSSGFQGIDLYDEQAINIVVSSTKSSYTMINLLTDLKQAFSRNRCKTNPNYNRCIFIYDVNNFDKSEQELLKEIETTEKEITYNCDLLNRLDGEEYQATLNRFQESSVFKYYTLYKNNKWYLNELAFNADKFFILETRKQFQKNIVLPYFSNEDIIIDKPKTVNPFSYNSILDKYKEFINNSDIAFTEEEKATEYYRLIDKYYKRFKSFTYNITYCRKMLESYNDNWLCLYNEVQNKISKQRYKLKDVKEILNAIYNKHNLKRKAKETDLNEFGFKYRTTTIKGYKHIYIE